MSCLEQDETKITPLCDKLSILDKDYIYEFFPNNELREDGKNILGIN
jgi:hypothetical protein